MLDQVDQKYRKECLTKLKINIYWTSANKKRFTSKNSLGKNALLRNGWSFLKGNHMTQVLLFPLHIRLLIMAKYFFEIFQLNIFMPPL